MKSNDTEALEKEPPTQCLLYQADATERENKGKKLYCDLLLYNCKKLC